jgi:hypothetical protein
MSSAFRHFSSSRHDRECKESSIRPFKPVLVGASPTTVTTFCSRIPTAEEVRRERIQCRCNPCREHHFVSGLRLRQRSNRLLSGRAGRKSLQAHQICGSENGATSSLVRAHAFGHVQRVQPPSGDVEKSAAPKSLFTFSAIQFSFIWRHLAPAAFRGSEIGVTSITTRLVAGSSPARSRLRGGSSEVEQEGSRAATRGGLFSDRFSPRFPLRQ